MAYAKRACTFIGVSLVLFIKLHRLAKIGSASFDAQADLSVTCSLMP